MVKDYKKRPGYLAGQRYRNPKIFLDSGKPKREKVNFLSLKSLKIIAIVVAVLFLVYYLFFSPVFQLKEIIIEGNSLVSDEEIRAVLPLGKNIFRADLPKMKEDILANFPEVKQAQVYRGIPDALKVVVNERDGRIIWQSDSVNYLVGSGGYVLKKYESESPPSNFPIVVDTKNLPIKVGQQIVSPSFVAFVANIFSGFEPEINIAPLNFAVTETTFDLDLHTGAGFYVKLNTLRSSQKQLDNLKLVLADFHDQIHEYVDLRIDGWAYYK